MRPKLWSLAALSLAFLGCSQPTKPVFSPATPAPHDALRLSAAREEAAHQIPGMTASLEFGRPREAQVSGAFRQDDFVITVHGLRLGADYFVQGVYELDGEPQWPIGFAGGLDFYTSPDGRLWEAIQEWFENTGAVARLKVNGNGFTYAVPLSAMHEPSGPITFAILVGSYSGSFFFRAFGRAECRQCPAAVRP